MNVRQIERYGWRRSLPDPRDYSYAKIFAEEIVKPPPPKYDLAGQLPPVWNQLALGSCVSHGVLRVFLTESMAQGEDLPMLSRLFVYYAGRTLEGTVRSDAGLEVRDGIKALAKAGAPREDYWPYDIAKFAHKPPARAYTDAVAHEALEYQSITLPGPGWPMRTAIATGHPVVVGFSVPDFFEDGSWDPATQALPLPTTSTSFLGGHCVALTGYDWTKTDYAEPVFIADNSWGESFGMKGRFALDYRWLEPQRNLAADFWTIRRTS